MKRFERDRAARLDGAKRLRARLAPALAVLEPLEAARVARLEREDVLRPRDQALGVELLDALLAQALDVEGVARDEMLQPLARLRRADEAAGAAAHRVLLAGARIDLAHRMAAAGRADGRERVGLRIRRALVEHHVEHLRDHVAGALDHDRVADADVDAAPDRLAVAADAADVVLVVQRGVRHHDAADRHRLELGERVERAGAADIDLDASTTVIAFCAGNLCASAQRGERETKPRPVLERRGRRPCRRRRRCRSRDWRARSRSRDSAPASRRRSRSGASAGWS